MSAGIQDDGEGGREEGGTTGREEGGRTKKGRDWGLLVFLFYSHESGDDYEGEVRG